jgi:hypothetical protein
MFPARDPSKRPSTRRLTSDLTTLDSRHNATGWELAPQRRSTKEASMAVVGSVGSLVGEGVIARPQWAQGIKGAPKKLWGLLGGLFGKSKEKPQ